MTLKKIVFYLLFLFVFSTLIYKLSTLLLPNYLFLSLSIDIFIELLYLSLLVFFSGLFFTLFITLANSWKMILPGIIIAILIPFIFLPTLLAIIFAATSSIALLIIYALLAIKLKTYIDFEAISFFNYSLSGFIFLFAIICTLIYYLYSSTVMLQTGFKIPEPIINRITEAVEEVYIPPAVNKNLSTLNDLGQSAIILKSLGLGNKDLGVISTTINQAADITKAIPTRVDIKNSIEVQMTKILKPYYQILAILLALLFFLILQVILWVFPLFSPIIFLILFFLMDKVGIVKIKKESKMVKRLNI